MKNKKEMKTEVSNLKVIKKLLLIGIILISVFSLIFLVSALTSELEIELSNLVSDLESGNYGWLVDYAVDYPSVEVYEENFSLKIADFGIIDENKKYQIYLDGSSGAGLGNKTQNIFDLKILGGSVEFDYIVDPITLSQTSSLNTNTTLEGNNLTHLNVSNSSIVAYYPFDDNVSSTTAYDYTNNSNDGTITGAVYNTSQAIYGGAFTFDGTNDYININPVLTNNLATTTTGTWSAWVKMPDATPTAEPQIFISFGTSTASTILYLGFLSSGVMRAFANNVGTTKWYLDTNTAITSDNTWVHVALVQNGTSPVLYVNGVAVAQTFGSTVDKTWWFNDNPTLNNGRIGNRNFNNGGETAFFNGSIDEVMLWNIALNSTEVLAIYNNQTARFHGTGEMNYTGVNFAGNDTINITLAGCQQNMGTSLRAKVNNGAYVNFDSSCLIKDYNATGNLNSANVTIGFVSDANSFYTPLVIGNITIETNPTYPTISYDPQTPADNSTIASNSIYVNVSVADANFENMSYSLYNESLNISGLVGYWNFDRNTTTIRDLSKQGNDGTRNGGVNWTTGGKLGEGFSFDGNGDYINVADHTSIDFDNTSPFSISAWIKRNGVGTGHTIVGKREGAPNFRGYQLDFTAANVLELDLLNTAANRLRMSTTSTFSADIWYHVVATYDGSQTPGGVKIYKNGVSDTLTTSTDALTATLLNNELLSIGATAGGVIPFNGSIDEVMIFNRALSSTEITDLYNRALVNHTTYSTITESINWTSLADNDYHYFVDVIDDAENYNFTPIRWVELNASFPTITINIPTNNTFTTDTSQDINFTAQSNDLSACWYSNDTYTANTTLANCNTNITTVQWSEGQHNVTIWVNDTANNVNSSMVTFTIDTTFPTWTANETNLTASTLNGKGVYFNITLTETNPSTYIFSWYNGTAWENTSASYTNAQEVSITKTINIDVATINWTWYINDSANNLNQTAVWSVTLLSDDSTPPNISFANPTTNATNLSQNFIFANLSFADATSSISMANISLFNSTQNIINSSQGTTSTLEINFTGLADGTYYLNASVNDTLGNRNQTETRKIILDTLSPNLTINSPTTGTYATSTILFNATSLDATTLVDSCWYTINSGTTNQTLSKDGTTNFYNFTQIGISDSTYTARFYCNDSANNVNNTQNVAFTIDTSVPAGGGPAPASAGGGGASAPSKPEKKRIFNLGYNMYDQTISLNQVEFDKLQITNNGEIADEYNIEVKTIEKIISFEEEKIKLEPGESKAVEFKISSPKEPGVYTGKIIVSNGISEREVLVAINVKTEKSLFDITLTIPESLKTLLIGQNLISKIDLIQMGLKENIDVTLNYAIKDFEGQTYLSESETIAVLDQKSYEKEFFTGELPPGQYVLGTELIHPDGVAVASTHFVVQERGVKFGKSEILLTSLILVLVLISLVLFLSIRKYKRIGKALKTGRK